MFAFMGGTLLHGVWCYLFIIHMGYGVIGAGIANSVTNMLIVVSTIIYSTFVPRIRIALFWPTADAFRNWGEYLRISLAATVMGCAAWWAVELLIIFSGYLGV
jgi:hypothetical protein